MRQKLAALALALGLAVCLGLGGASADDKTKAEKATVEAVSMQVTRKLDAKKFPFSGASVSLNAQITYPGKQILAVDNSSALTEFRDDKDTDFIKAAGFFKPTFRQSQLATDRSGVIVTASVFNAEPARGASKIQVKGKVVLVCGIEEKNTEEKEVEMKDKAEATLGDFALKVTQEKGFGGAGATFSISSSKPTLKTVTVKDAEGKAVETMTFGSPFLGFDKKWTVSYTLRKPVTKVKVTVTYFDKEEKVTVPVDLAVGVGL
jgi:hypothetical protein